MRRIFATLLVLALFTTAGFAGERGPGALATQLGGTHAKSIPLANADSASMMETLEPLALGFSETARAHRTGTRGGGGFRLAGARYRDFDCPGGMPTCTL